MFKIQLFFKEDLRSPDWEHHCLKVESPPTPGGYWVIWYTDLHDGLRQPHMIAFPERRIKAVKIIGEGGEDTTWDSMDINAAQSAEQTSKAVETS